MHAWLASILAVGIILLITAIFGITIFALNSQIWIALIVAAVVSIVIAIWLIYAAARAQYIKIKTGKEALIGSQGEATTEIAPKGEIRIMGEFWQAKSVSGHISKGQVIEVVGMEGMFLTVKASKGKSLTPKESE
jgi:membrane-bound serine protease (ClpP class)